MLTHPRNGPLRPTPANIRRWEIADRSPSTLRAGPLRGGRWGLFVNVNVKVNVNECLGVGERIAKEIADYFRR